jgi:hypothetical protein
MKSGFTPAAMRWWRRCAASRRSRPRCPACMISAKGRSSRQRTAARVSERGLAAGTASSGLILGVALRLATTLSLWRGGPLLSVACRLRGERRQTT